MKRIVITVAALLALYPASPSLAQVPTTMSYQGVLSDGTGSLVPDGNYDLTFLLYKVGSGTPVWSELHVGVPIAKGSFSVVLGADPSTPVPLNLPFDEPYFLAVSVNGGPELSPAIPLAASPYSLMAKSLYLPFSATISTSSPALEIVNAGSGRVIEARTTSTEADVYAIRGEVSSLTPGAVACAVRGDCRSTTSQGIAVRGRHEGSGIAVYGEALTGGHGVLGISNNGIGVLGSSQENTGVYGQSNSGIGVRAQCESNVGLYATSESYVAVYGSTTTGYAGFFQGDVVVNGSLQVSGAKNFKIDHPLDPQGKTLSHTCVESAEVTNLYTGNAVLDVKGEAWVTMPAWFEALNCDFRYQLTPIGAPAAGLFIAEKMNRNRFRIAGGAPGLEVSWQVTGIRHDPSALANPVAVEAPKPAKDRGRYLDPQAFGQPKEKAIGWVQRDPKSERAIEELARAEDR
jgi:hypothetical protein